MQALSPPWYPPSYKFPKHVSTKQLFSTKPVSTKPVSTKQSNDDAMIEEWFRVVSECDTICKDFVLGKCERRHCYYEHPSPLKGLRWKDGTQICVADLFGELCRRGKRCIFFHPSTKTIPLSSLKLDRIRRSRRETPACSPITRCDTINWRREKGMKPIGPSSTKPKTRTIAIQTDPVGAVDSYSLFDGPSLFAFPVVSSHCWDRSKVHSGYQI